MGRGIPDGWYDYTSIGDLICGTRFIPFKVPLKEQLLRVHDVSEEDWFTPTIMINKMKEQDKEIGLIIDLTNTNRYYDSKEITNAGIGYVKIFTEGKVVPCVDVQNKFFDTVDKFISENQHNNLFIGVHCTHGLNRTGYLICRYMISRTNCKGEDAINAFNHARGHVIERQEYIDDLTKTNT